MEECIKFMKQALKEAEKAFLKDEVPVGAVMVQDGKIIARAHNTKNSKNNALLHSEIILLFKTMKKLGDWHLNDCSLYVTMEPCPMCAGAIINSRIGKVVFGASDQKAGCFGSVLDFSKEKFNHKPEIIGGVMQKECSQILTKFFEAKRGNKCK